MPNIDKKEEENTHELRPSIFWKSVKNKHDGL